MENCIHIRCYNDRYHNGKEDCEMLLASYKVINEHTINIYTRCSKCKVVWETTIDLIEDTVVNKKLTGTIKDHIKLFPGLQVIE